MSTKLFSGTITTRYGEPDKDIYQQVMDLVEKERIAKSRAQLLLVKRGLQHVSNPEPLIKTVVKEVPVEKIKTVIKEVPVYKSPPKVDTSTPHTQEHVSIEEHITDGHIQGDLQNTGQRSSADKLATRDKADPPSPSSKALKEKKSATKENGSTGWKVAGGLGVAGLVGLIAYKIWQVYH